MSEPRTDADHTPPTVAHDPTGRLTATEVTAIQAWREVSAGAPEAEVDGFAMDHERWGTLREGVTGDLAGVITAYKQLEAREDAEPAAPLGAPQVTARRSPDPAAPPGGAITGATIGHDEPV